MAKVWEDLIKPKLATLHLGAEMCPIVLEARRAQHGVTLAVEGA